MRSPNYDPNFNPMAGVTIWHFIGFIVFCFVVSVVCAMASEEN